MPDPASSYRWRVLGVVVLVNALGVGVTWNYVVMVVPELLGDLVVGYDPADHAISDGSAERRILSFLNGSCQQVAGRWKQRRNGALVGAPLPLLQAGS